MRGIRQISLQHKRGEKKEGEERKKLDKVREENLEICRPCSLLATP